MRILHCPTMVGGNPQGLARAERKIGLKSWSVAFDTTSFDFVCDEILWKDTKNCFMREIKRAQLLWRALNDFDIVHFNFGRSIMPHWVALEKRGTYTKNVCMQAVYGVYAHWFGLKDLPLLKKAGKGIVVTYQGSDARQEDYCRAHYQVTFASEKAPYDMAESDRQKRKQIELFARYADRIFALNPELLHVLPAHARFMPYAHIDLTQWHACTHAQDQTKVPLVIHAPSDQRLKGTRFVVDAVNRLRREGIVFDFVLIEGLTQQQARALYEEADLLIDQLLIGWYGGLAVECMALSKPVICYLRNEDLRYIPEGMKEELPLIYADPHTIYAVLKEWLTVKRNLLAQRGSMSRRYVEKWHNPDTVAHMLEKEYRTILTSTHAHKNIASQ